MSAAYDVARALDPHAPQGRKSWQVPCPVHEDRDPSLSIRDADGKVLVHCHAGCKQQDVIAVLRDHGLCPRARRAWVAPHPGAWPPSRGPINSRSRRGSTHSRFGGPRSQRSTRWSRPISPAAA